MKRRRPRAALGEPSGALNEGLWMIPYADLMTTMVILFLALFAYSFGKRSPAFDQALAQMKRDLSPDGSKEADARVREAELAVKIEQAMKGLALEEFGVRMTARHIHLTLPSPVLFREGSARLSARAAKILDPLSRILAATPHEVLVAGHTDTVPIVGGRYKTNWELSAARSFSVIHYLSRKGLKPERFRARGYGEFRPVAGNDTPEGRGRNRRIELSIVREVAFQ